jgi:hypothetical protein
VWSFSLKDSQNQHHTIFLFHNPSEEPPKKKKFLLLIQYTTNNPQHKKRWSFALNVCWLTHKLTIHKMKSEEQSGKKWGCKVQEWTVHVTYTIPKNQEREREHTLVSHPRFWVWAEEWIPPKWSHRDQTCPNSINQPQSTAAEKPLISKPQITTSLTTNFITKTT